MSQQDLSFQQALASQREFDYLLEEDDAELERLSNAIENGEIIPQSIPAVLSPPKSPQKIKTSGIMNRSRQSAALYASHLSTISSVSGELPEDPRRALIDGVITDVLDLMSSAKKGELAGADLATPPKHIIILVDNSERSVGFSRNGSAARERYIYNIIDTLQTKGKEATKKNPNDKRHSKIFVCLREIMHNHQVSLGLPGMFANHKNQKMSVPHYMDFEVAIIMKALRGSGIKSASFSCSDLIFIDEEGKARKFVEHKTFPDLRNCTYGQEVDKFNTQIANLHGLQETLGVPVEIVVSGQCSINDTSSAKALVNKIRTSDLGWFFTFDSDTLAYFVMHTALHLLDPNERYQRASFLRSDIMSRVYDIKDVTPLDFLKASLVSIKGVSVEIAMAFIIHGINSIFQLIEFGKTHGKQAFMDLKTKGDESAGGRRIGLKGAEIYFALGFPSDEVTPLPEDSPFTIPGAPTSSAAKKRANKGAPSSRAKKQKKRESGAHTSDEEERYTGLPFETSGPEIPSDAAKKKLQDFSAASKNKKSKVSASNFVAKKTTFEKIQFTSSESEAEDPKVKTREEDSDHTTDGGSAAEDELGEEEEEVKEVQPNRKIAIPVTKKAFVYKKGSDSDDNF